MINRAGDQVFTCYEIGQGLELALESHKLWSQTASVRIWALPLTWARCLPSVSSSVKWIEIVPI